MKWQTEVPVQAGLTKINYDRPVTVFGSCFAQNMGDQLDYYKYRNLSNPFGVIFHPIPILRLIERAISDLQFTDEDLINRDRLWFSLEAHGSLYATTGEELLNLLNDRLAQIRSWLTNSSHMILTLGTAWGYRHLETDLLVANCHKLPQEHFHKELTPIGAIESTLRKLIKAIRGINKDITLILTVSPVRHLKDGLQENNRSKAHLLSAVHQVVENNDSLYYFPSYEILLDELRDYRFYAEDLLHPSGEAVKYIWDRFAVSWLDPEQQKTRKQVDSIQKRLRHKPLHPESDDFLDFSLKLKHDITALRKKLPWAYFEE